MENVSERRINILYQCDDNFAFMAGVSFTSLVIHADPAIKYYVYVLTPDMSLENKDKWHNCISMHNKTDNVYLKFLDAAICVNEVQSWNVPSHRGSWVTYFKLLLDRYFCDTDVDHILHIGADTLVTGSLEDLVDFDFHGKPFAMNWNEGVHCPRYPKDAQYCIAEMIYFNLPIWRDHNCEERIINYIKKNGDLYGSKDQGILCTQFIGEYAQLPLKFNIYGMSYYFRPFARRLLNNAPILSREEIKDAYSNPEIIHIARTFLFRPCEKNSLDRLYDMWWYYCNKSPWHDMYPIEPSPELLPSEKFFRTLFTVLPGNIFDIIYVLARHGSINVYWLLWRLNILK